MPENQAAIYAQMIADIYNWDAFVLASPDIQITRDSRTGKYRGVLMRATGMPNVWIDTNWSEVRCLNDHTVCDLDDHAVDCLDEACGRLFDFDHTNVEANLEKVSSDLAGKYVRLRQRARLLRDGFFTDLREKRRRKRAKGLVKAGAGWGAKQKAPESLPEAADPAEETMGWEGFDEVRARKLHASPVDVPEARAAAPAEPDYHVPDDRQAQAQSADVVDVVAMPAHKVPEDR